MDDNRLLTLPNGERIRLAAHARLLFEVGDLAHASPATVSRCGMVYVDGGALGWRPYVWRWLNQRGAGSGGAGAGSGSIDGEAAGAAAAGGSGGGGGGGRADALRPLFEKYAAPAIAWVTEGVDAGGGDGGAVAGRPPAQVVPRTALNLAAQLCELLDAALAAAEGAGGSGDSGGPDAAATSAGAAAGAAAAAPSPLDDARVLEALFLFCCVWSVGACLVQRGEARGRARFDALLRRLAAMPEAGGDW